MDIPALEEHLRTAMLDILDGAPAGPLFASRVRRTATEVLARAGLRGQIEVRDGGRHLIVRVRVRDRVQTLQLEVSER